MKEILIEIWESVRRNKLRTCLTGFAVSWGIFMLIVLLGAGNGLMNSFLSDGDGFASNTMELIGGYTSKPYDGLNSGRRIELDDRDIRLTESEQFSDIIDEVLPSVGTSVQLSFGKKYSSGYIEGDYPNKQDIQKIEILHGRFINDKDIEEKRKVVVLPQNIVSNLQEGNKDTEHFLGSRVKINGLYFKVVGIMKTDEMSSDNVLYAPFTTVKTVYAKGQALDNVTFTFHGLKTEEDNEAFEKKYKAVINRAHHAAPDDDRATYINNYFTQNMQMNKATRLLTIALWVIGIFTLLSGIVGVSNIMLITVKERTHEFGIRKAIGAKPSDISRLIVTESVCITAFFGYIGMVLGMVACQIMDATIGGKQTSLMDGEIQFTAFVDPTVGLDVAIEATLLLIIAGTVAGFFPARKATKVRPIEALRAD